MHNGRSSKNHLKRKFQRLPILWRFFIITHISTDFFSKCMYLNQKKRMSQDASERVKKNCVISNTLFCVLMQYIWPRVKKGKSIPPFEAASIGKL